MAKSRGRITENYQENTKLNFENYKLMTVSDYFIEYLFPDAIIYGMSYDEFWYKDPELFFSYRFSFLKKLEIDQRKMNYECWLQGLYNYQAHSIALYNGFNDKGFPKEYPKEPLDIFSEKKDKNTEEHFLDTRHFWSRFKERRND